MSYLPPPTNSQATAPAVTDDISKGYIVGSIIVNTGVSPSVAYICKDSSLGAAIWSAAGGGAATLIAIAISGAVDTTAVLSPLSTPTNSATSNGTIGGP